MSLKKVAKQEPLFKVAEDGKRNNGVVQMVTEESYSILNSTFPKLTPFIVGVDMADKTEGTSIIGGANLIINDTKYIIPIVYNGKKTVTGIMIYSEEHDTMLGLTKALVSKITSSTSGIDGTSSSKKIAFDKGNINSLFIPPKTFSPKVASGSLFYSAMEDPDVKKVFSDAMNSSSDMKDFISSEYGQDAVDSIHQGHMEKVAKEQVDMSAPEVISTFEELSNTDWIFKKAAAKEISNYGISISSGEGNANKSLIPLESQESILKSLFHTEATEVISNSGFYKIYDKGTGKLIHAFVEVSKDKTLGHKRSKVFSDGAVEYDCYGVVGVPVNPEEVSFLRYPSRESLVDLDCMIILKDGKFYKELDDLSNLSFTMSSAKFRDNEDKVDVEIGFNSDSQPMISMGTIFVGDSNVRVIPKNGGSISPAVLADLESEEFSRNHYQSNKIVKLVKDPSGKFVFEGKLIGKDVVAKLLLDRGYDKMSVLMLAKTAASKDESSFVSVDRKLDEIAGMISNLSGRISVVEKTVTEISNEEKKEKIEEANEKAEKIESANQQQELEPQQQPQIGGFIDSASGFAPLNQAPAEDPLAQQQAAEAQNQQTLQAEQNFQQQLIGVGVNPNIGSETLASLKDFKDSTAMDISAITMLAQNSEIGEALAGLLPQFQEGVSAIGKMLFNFIAREEIIVNSIGEKNYKKTVMDLKTILVKTTDLYIDITASKQSLTQD